VVRKDLYFTLPLSTSAYQVHQSRQAFAFSKAPSSYFHIASNQPLFCQLKSRRKIEFSTVPLKCIVLSLRYTYITPYNC